MASNDQWPPVALSAGGKGSSKLNGNKRNIKDSQQKILEVVNEMFGSALEPEVILSVVQNCNWELQPSIEGLITLTETVENPLTRNALDSEVKTMSSDVAKMSEKFGANVNLGETECVSKTQVASSNISENRSSQDSVLPSKSEKPKKGAAKNRMGSFCGNIAKLKSSVENKDIKIEQENYSSILTKGDLFFDGLVNYGATGRDELLITGPKIPSGGDTSGTGQFFDLKNANSPTKERKNKGSPKNLGYQPAGERNKRDNNEKATYHIKYRENKNQKVASFDSKANIRKSESESLCGLKVQYRLSGMESSSDDDDADVVIEDESSDYEINLAPTMTTNVCQFLSPPTQTPPQQTQPEIHMINTPSPPRTPQRSMHDSTLSRSKFAILRGEKIMILMRGLPGSGKTALAKNLIAKTMNVHSASHVFSTDDFFVTLGRGVYQYDATRIPEAHSSNQKRVRNAAKNGLSPIIVDNTNIETWEMRPYAAMAVEYGYIVEILEPNTPWARNPKQLAEKNSHNVPKSKIREKLQRYAFGITGKKLLDLYELKYASHNTPPQMRLSPPITANTEQEKFVPCMADIKSNWDNHQKNNYVLTSHDIESMQNIDESHNSKNDCATLPDASSNSSGTDNPDDSPNYAEQMFNDCLDELQDSDDESFELLDGPGNENSSDIGKSTDGVENSSQRNLETFQNTSEDALDDCIKVNKEPSPNSSQQTLGAIGSERKGSLAVTANIENSGCEKNDHEMSDNVLSQCWDFTMILGRCKLHSSHGNYVSPFKVPAQMSMKKGDETNDEKVTADIAENTNGSQQSKIDEDQNVVSKSAIVVNEELISENADNAVDLYDKLAMDEKKIENMVKISTNIDDELQCEVEEEDIEKNDMNVLEQLIPSGASFLQDCTDSIVKDLCDLGIEITEEDTQKDVSKPENAMSFVELFNMIKTIDSQILNLRRPDESSTTVDSKSQDSNNTDKIVYSNFTENDDDEEESFIYLDTMDSPKMKKDNGITEEIVTDMIKEQNEIVDEACEAVSTNPFMEEIIRLKSEKDVKGVTNLATDNINSISWKESPFPIDGANIPTISSTDDHKTVLKIEASTNTTNYDFNVAYVGGTSEPEYRELRGSNRCINESGPSVVVKQERPPLKLMLDKSSMTNESNILATETHLNTDKEKDSINRLADLIEMFPRFPVEYLQELYEEQCNRDFDWTVDVLLLADVPNDFTIENYEKKKCADIATDESNTTSRTDAVKLWKTEHEKLKQRSHSSSPRNRRSRAKDFRSFSLDCIEDHHWSGGESPLNVDDFNISKDSNSTKANEEEDKLFELFYAKAISDNIPDGNADLPEASSSSTASGQTSEVIENDEDNEEIMELNFGREFISQLEKTFGNLDYNLPDEFKPVIRIKKSMAEELHGLWIQSMYHQMNALHAQLDERMAKDEAMARIMDREESVQTTIEPAVPNLEEIMNMEMALAKYKNELKEVIERETPNDMASRLTRQMLYESLPDLDQQTLSEILYAHGGNFKETCEIIEASTGRTVSKMVTLKKQQSLLDRVNEEQKNRCIESLYQQDATVTPTIIVNPDFYMNGKTEKSILRDALARGQEARMEAQKQFTLRVENFNKAAEAYRKGYPDVAAYYLQMAKLHSENIKAAHADAADAFLSAQMYTADEENTLDLHNLYVSEAVKAMDVFLDRQIKKLAKSNKKSTVLYVITGRGARSNNRLSKIKPAISKKLISRNIKFTEANPGCLKVTLSKRNGISD